VFVAVATVVAACGRYAPSTFAAVVVNNQFDVFGYGCAWHGSLPKGS
jgi:hypothetical protein